MYFSYLLLLGHPLPHRFQTSPFVHTSRIRKSFTIPQPRKFSCQEPLIISSTPPSPEITLEQETIEDEQEVDFFLAASSSSIPTLRSATIKSTNSTTFSESSVESRISSRLCPEDATYPSRGGLFGLADCMSSRSKNKI